MRKKSPLIETKIRFFKQGRTEQNGFPFPNVHVALKDLQSEQIKESTHFLYFVYRDRRGYHSGWAWSEDRNRLLSFLFNNLLSRSLSLEMGVEPDYAYGFERSFDTYLSAFPLPKGEGAPLPKEVLSLLGSLAVLFSETGTTSSSYNESSIPLQNHFSSFFYSVNWLWVDGEKDVRKELMTHLPKERLSSYPLRILLRSDKTF